MNTYLKTLALACAITSFTLTLSSSTLPEAYDKCYESGYASEWWDQEAR